MMRLTFYNLQSLRYTHLKGGNFSNLLVLWQSLTGSNHDSYTFSALRLQYRIDNMKGWISTPRHGDSTLEHDDKTDTVGLMAWVLTRPCTRPSH